MDRIKYIVILIGLILMGCQNPVTTEQANKMAVPPDTLSFSIHQNYGYCDSNGCYTEDILLLEDLVISDRGYGFYFQTQGDSIYAYNQWLKYTNCYFIYQTTGDYTFNVTIDKCFSAQGSGYRILNLQSNTNYNIQIQ